MAESVAEALIRELRESPDLLKRFREVLVGRGADPVFVVAGGRTQFDVFAVAHRDKYPAGSLRRLVGPGCLDGAKQPRVVLTDGHRLRPDWPEVLAKAEALGATFERVSINGD